MKPKLIASQFPSPVSFPVSFPVASGMKLGREFQLYRRTMYAPRSSAPNS